MSKYGKLILEGLGVVLAAGVIIFFVGTAHSNASKVNAQPNDPNPAQAENADSTEGAYACPMHPDQTTNDPNGTCPICGMKVVPKDQIGNDKQDQTYPLHGGYHMHDSNDMHDGSM
jgi:Cu(I)/Ag(I) efflux system membrane fusion protein